MKKYKTIVQHEVTQLTCDACGLEAYDDAGYEFREFITIEHQCGYGSIHGDDKQLSIGLCQQCFANMCGDTLKIIDSLGSQPLEPSSKDTLEYDNIFQAISKSKIEATKLKKDSDLKINARDILSVDKISNQEELKTALKRVEQLWGAQYRSTEGNELHRLADLICAYENKSWDSYFAQEPLADDDFMPERLNFETKISFQKMGAAKGKLSNIPFNKGTDDDASLQSSIDEDNTE